MTRRSILQVFLIVAVSVSPFIQAEKIKPIPLTKEQQAENQKVLKQITLEGKKQIKEIKEAYQDDSADREEAVIKIKTQALKRQLRLSSQMHGPLGDFFESYHSLSLKSILLEKGSFAKDNSMFDALQAAADQNLSPGSLQLAKKATSSAIDAHGNHNRIFEQILTIKPKKEAFVSSMELAFADSVTEAVTQSAQEPREIHNLHSARYKLILEMIEFYQKNRNHLTVGEDFWDVTSKDPALQKQLKEFNERNEKIETAMEE